MTGKGANCVPNLIAKTALQGVAAVSHAGTTLAEIDLGQVTAIACFPDEAPCWRRGL